MKNNNNKVINLNIWKREKKGLQCPDCNHYTIQEATDNYEDELILIHFCTNPNCNYYDVSV